MIYDLARRETVRLVWKIVRCSDLAFILAYAVPIIIISPYYTQQSDQIIIETARTTPKNEFFETKIQVHKATLLSGEAVAVKIVHPGPGHKRTHSLTFHERQITIALEGLMVTRGVVLFFTSVLISSYSVISLFYSALTTQMPNN